MEQKSMSIEQWRNDDYLGKTEKIGVNLLQCHFACYESPLKSPGIEPMSVL
jgi:hypothetical protein